MIIEGCNLLKVTQVICDRFETMHDKVGLNRCSQLLLLVIAFWNIEWEIRHCIYMTWLFILHFVNLSPNSEGTNGEAFWALV